MEASVAKPATIGQQTYEAITGMIGEGLKPTQAFAKYAEKTGKNAASVATAYYRVARGVEDSPVVARPRRATVKTKRGRPAASMTVSLKAAGAISKIQEGIKELNALLPQIRDADTYAQIKKYL